MAQDVATIERIPARPIAVDPVAIEDAFSTVWQETAGDGYDASSVRLRVLNFVAIVSGSDAEARWDRVMEAMPRRYPCRGILALLEPSAAAVSASISARCWTAAGVGRHVCSEEVTLRGRVEQGRAVASVVLALLLPEVPVDLWITGAPLLSGDLVDELLEAADRLFIDSSLADDITATYGDALALVSDRSIVVCDLAWHRLAAWRSLLAQFFDRDATIEELSRLRSIEIAGGAASPSSEALMLAGWFVSRLGLSPADCSLEGGRLDATLYDGTRGIRLSVRPDGEAGLPLRSATVTTEGATFLVELHAASGHMHVCESLLAGASDRTVAMQPVDDASVLTQALDDPDDRSVVLDAMRAVLALRSVAEGAA